MINLSKFFISTYVICNTLMYKFCFVQVERLTVLRCRHKSKTFIDVISFLYIEYLIYKIYFYL